MIPKRIHYCWFGGKDKPDLVKRCMSSWKRNLPDYEIVEWNESNADLHANRFVQEAYERRKWAFVADYVRMFALYSQGGVYLDTDVEVVRSFDEFLNAVSFTGYEVEEYCLTCVIGSVRHGRYVKEMLDEYDSRPFILPDGTLNTTPNVSYATKLIAAHGGVFNGKKIDIPDFITVYPKDFFVSPRYDDGSITTTQNTFAIHHMQGSWLTPTARFAKWIGHRTHPLAEYYINYFARRPDKIVRSLGEAVLRRMHGESEHGNN